jgi:hypothetical protein
VLAALAALLLSSAWLTMATRAAEPAEEDPRPQPAAAAPNDRAVEAVAKVDFNREIRPILAKNCFVCHGTDESSRAKGLRLDLREAATAALEDGETAIVPGDPDASALLLRVTEEHDTLRMPPRKVGPRLSQSEVELLRRWIAQGAGYETHWALVPPVAHPGPAVQNQGWPRGPIDRFILARLEAEGLTPNPEADPYTLLRRLSLDLRGLPPTPEEVRRFLNERENDPLAYERAVDRFLDDPAYGEKWARMWLDLARYADSAGYGSDPLRPNMWRYRDWVIDAFNRNLPYDEFTLWQIAGDLLPSASLEQRMATAFHRNTMTNTEGGTDDEEWRVAAVKDRADTTMQVWMGLTLGCAKCHSHKYDPITQTEYYQFYAFFNQTADADRPDESPVIPAPTPESEAAQQSFEAKLTALKAKLTAKPVPDAAGADAIKKEIEALEKQKPQAPTLPVLVELPAAQHRTTRLLRKGNFLEPAEEVTAGVPASLHPLAPGAPADRLALARWLVDRRNPLTARVAVNRFWSQIFGTGLVETEEDFGTQGENPSHPELLDTLAVDFMESGWNVKSLLRRIVCSASYRQASRPSPEALAKDPKNRLLSRAPRYRLEAEMVRDQALALSGLLARQVGGPSVFPPQPDGLWQAAFNGQRTWSTSAGSDRHRRGLYTFWRRTVPYPSMAAFDAPSREICAIRRVRTNTPLQAFVTLNDPVYVEAAQALARRIVREGGRSTADRARFGLSLCLVRPPAEGSVQTVVALFDDALARYKNDRAAAVSLATEPIGPLPDGLDPAELAAWTTVANVLLNLDGVLTKG